MRFIPFDDLIEQVQTLVEVVMLGQTFAIYIANNIDVPQGIRVEHVIQLSGTSY